VDVRDNGIVDVGSVSHTVMSPQFEHKKLLTTNSPQQLPMQKVRCGPNLDLRFGPVHLVLDLEPIKTGLVHPFTGPDTGPNRGQCSSHRSIIPRFYCTRPHCI